MSLVFGSSVFEFDGFRIDAKLRRLSRVDSGEVISLTPRAFDLLYYLSTNAGRVISKEELMETVWDGSAVEESNLSQTIFVLRKVLGEDKKAPRLILTVPGIGYRFIANVEAIGEKQSHDPRRILTDRQGTSSNEAYQAYVRGRFFWNKRTAVSLRQAVAHFEQAIEKDPKFAHAYTGLSDSYRLLSEYYAAATPNISMNKAKAAISRSQEIDEQLSEAHASLAYAQAFYDWDWATAEESFRSALEIDPLNATTHQWYAELMMVRGRFEEARKHIDQAVEISPVSTAIQTSLAVFYYLQRDANSLISQARQILKHDPNSGYGHFYLGFGYEFAENYKVAVDEFGRAAIAFGEPADIAEELRLAYERGGMPAVWYKRLEQYATREHLAEYPPFLKSLVPARLGDREMMYRFLGEALEQRDRGLIYINEEPFLAPYKDESQMEAIVKELRFE